MSIGLIRVSEGSQFDRFCCGKTFGEEGLFRSTLWPWSALDHTECKREKADLLGATFVWAQFVSSVEVLPERWTIDDTGNVQIVEKLNRSWSGTWAEPHQASGFHYHSSLWRSNVSGEGSSAANDYFKRKIFVCFTSGWACRWCANWFCY